VSERINKYDRALSSVVACRIKQRRAITPEDRNKAANALHHATTRAVSVWLSSTSSGCQARVRYATCPSLLQAEAITAVVADARTKEKQTTTMPEEV
jgi:hypothetical protein